jgi:uncharacterized membrane protein YphA (DoxX/SURF4 family)
MSGGFVALLDLISSVLSLLARPSGYGTALWFLALVFAWSGVVKLRRPVSAALAIVDFGLTKRVYPSLGWLVGLGETLLALALAAGLFPPLALSGAAILLWFFSALIGRSLLAGKSFACFCFGDSGSALSRATLARTGALALFATLVAALPTPNPLWTDWQVPAFQAIVAASLLGTIALIGSMPQLLRAYKDLTQRPAISIKELQQ